MWVERRTPSTPRRLPETTLRARALGLRESKIHRAREDYSSSLYLIPVAFMHKGSVKPRQQLTQRPARLSVSNARFKPRVPVKSCLAYLRTIMRLTAPRGNTKADDMRCFFRLKTFRHTKSRQKKARSLRRGLLIGSVLLTLSKKDPKRRYDHVGRLAMHSESRKALRQ